MTKLEPRPLEQISPALPEMTTLQSALIAAKVKIYDPMEVEAYKTETTRRSQRQRTRPNVMLASVSSGLAVGLGLMMGLMHERRLLPLFGGMVVFALIQWVRWACESASWNAPAPWRTVSYAVYHALSFGVIPDAVQDDLRRIQKRANFSVRDMVEIDTLEKDPVMWIRDPDDPGARYCIAIWD